MKMIIRIAFICAVQTILSLSAYSANLSKVLDFDPDYDITETENGDAIITWNSSPCFYGNNTSETALPQITYAMELPSGSVAKSISYEVLANNLVYSGRIATNPALVTENGISINNQVVPSIDTERVILGNQYTSEEGKTMVNLLVSPFVYEEQKKQLYLSSIKVYIEFEEQVAKATNKIVPEPIKNLLEKFFNVSSPSDNPDYMLDYLIVTNSAMKPAFERLLSWKRSKGLKGMIVVPEDLVEIGFQFTGDAEYAGTLHSLFFFLQNYGLKYVLLGGDETVVPAPNGYGFALDTQDKSIPTDFFYSGYFKNWEEDADNWTLDPDGSFGKDLNFGDLRIFLSVARVPVASLAMANGVVDKIIMYEKNPKVNGWSNKALTCGDFKDFDTDAEQFGNYVYNHSFMNLWNGSRVRFYDTRPLNVEGSNVEFSATALCDELAKGYSFIHIIGKGRQTGWEFSNSTFYGTYAAVLKSSQFSIITTPSSFVNAFDRTDGSDRMPNEVNLNSRYCGTEYMIGGAENGIVGMLGSSREGWFYSGQQYTKSPSIEFERIFYHVLFSPNFKSKSFGDVVLNVKSQQLGLFPYNMSEAYKWLIFSVNPIGDPEMPIYTTTPIDWDGTSISVSNGILSVSTPNNNCVVGTCSSEELNNSQRYTTSSGSTNLPINQPTTLSLLDMNYVPFQIKCDSNSLQLFREYYTGIHNFNADSVVVGDDGGNEVVLKNGEFTFDTKEVTFKPGARIDCNTEVKLIKR